MRDNWLIIYMYKGKKHNEFGCFQRVKTVKSFADEVITTEFIG